MNSLAQLKREAKKYYWTMEVNTLFPDGGKLIGLKRKIEHVQSNSIKFENGSWLDWPKASQLTIVKNNGKLGIRINFEEFYMFYNLELI